MHRPRVSGSRSQPEMGVRESDTLPIDEVTRALNSLMNEPSTESRPQTLLPRSLAEKYIIEGRRNYYTQVLFTIRKTKRDFITQYQNIITNIESATAQIIASAKRREEELKNLLSSVREEKLSRWNEQLSICDNALGFLHYWESDQSNESTFPESYCDDNFSRNLNFVDAGEIRFDPGRYDDIMQPLQTWGTVRCYRDGDFRQTASRSVIPKIVFGSSGLESGQFCRPWGVCSDATGRILVCDRSNHRVQIFNECGEFILQFGRQGSKAGEFNLPTGIDVDGQFRIVVADKDNHRIQIFSYSGSFIMEFGCQGSKPGQFMYPWDVATNRNYDIAVSDSKNHRIQLFNFKGVLLTYLDAKSRGIQNHRLALQFLDSPRGLSFRPDGKLLATDFNNHRVLIINQSFTEVEYLGREGSNAEEFFRPQGIACDKTGRFAVADCKNYRIKVFDFEGHLLKCFGRQGILPGEFDCPQGICFHSNGNIIVVDLNNSRVQVF